MTREGPLLKLLCQKIFSHKFNNKIYNLAESKSSNIIEQIKKNRNINEASINNVQQFNGFGIIELNIWLSNLSLPLHHVHLLHLKMKFNEFHLTRLCARMKTGFLFFFISFLGHFCLLPTKCTFLSISKILRSHTLREFNNTVRNLGRQNSLQSYAGILYEIYTSLHNPSKQFNIIVHKTF